ncbi:MAG: DUF1385 domain-containing protein [Oscillospiraceae bacterium]|nr:DUF1385 domain-containing protein [Oscillospiraceae bacterium]
MSKNKVEVKKKTSIGGQALIEGVMMRGPEKSAMAVRNPEGEIVLESWVTYTKKRPRILKLPFIRGVINFVESMAVGYKCLMRSAELAGLEDDEPKPGKKNAVAVEVIAGASGGDASSPQAQTPAQADTPPEPIQIQEEEAQREQKQDSGGFSKLGMTLIFVISMLFGIALAIGLFIMLPVFLFERLSIIFPAFDNRILRAVFEGLIRIILFVAYIASVSLMKDIKRVFMYHGAEHKTIFCFEKGEELTVENVRRQIRFHPRCGTSFMILMLLVGIVVSMFIPFTNIILRTGTKLLTIPIIVSIGYELIKLAGRTDHWIMRAISAPGIWLQRVTTKEPTDDMIEVAIKSFTAVIPDEPEADRL